MKYRATPRQFDDVMITTELDRDGYLWLTANGVRMAFFDLKGLLTICRDEDGLLKEMGFQMCKSGNAIDVVGYDD